MKDDQDDNNDSNDGGNNDSLFLLMDQQYHRPPNTNGNDNHGNDDHHHHESDCLASSLIRNPLNLDDTTTTTVENHRTTYNEDSNHDNNHSSSLDDHPAINNDTTNNHHNHHPYKTPSLRGDGYGGGGWDNRYNDDNTIRHCHTRRRRPKVGNENDNDPTSTTATTIDQQEQLEQDQYTLNNNYYSAGGGGVDCRNRHNHKHRNDVIQSHNYELDENEVWRAYVTQVHFQNRGQWWTTCKKRALKRWIVTLIIGITQALIAATSNCISKLLSSYKFKYIYQLLHQVSTITQAANSAAAAINYTILYDDNVTTTSSSTYYRNTNGRIDSDEMMVSSASFSNDYNNHHHNYEYYAIIGKAFFMYILFQVSYTAIASIFVWIEPLSGGSGIPEVKCFLNGINIPRIARVRTLVCRVLGVIFSVASGLPIGMEGPMVHSGAVVAAGISQGKTTLFGVFDTSFSKFNDFRNDREKRDFVACGTAAGVCSAFGSPIGGVLFAFEETSSYFTTKLTWRAFFCAMTTLATLFWFRNVGSLWGQANIEKLFSLGEFNSLTGDDSNFSIWELSLFIIIGCFGGLIGAVFNAASERITKYRMKRINHSKTRRFIEVLLISLTVSIISFVTPLLWGHCTPLPTDTGDWTNQEKHLIASLVPFQCIPGKEYNEVASLTFTEADTAIKQLFHFREAGGADDTKRTFSSGAVFLFFVPYIVMATITYGSAVPSGLFVPSLLSGAAFGRLVAHLLHKLDHTNGTFADSGTYALIGSAAILGGMARMTISLTVILLEATGDMQYVLPLMFTLMAARFTGNVFNDGIYDISIKLNNIPFLEPDVPAIAERNEIVAGQVMATEVKCLRPVERAGVVYDLLRTCGHGNFPIVDTTTGGTLYGTASRHILCTLLQRRAFGCPDVFDEYDCPQQNLGPRRLSPLVQWDTIERVYPRYPTIADVDMKPTDRNSWLDLRPYANTAPYTVNETASIQRTYRLFRTLGLRFLCVVNHNNQVVGIITRKDLMPDALKYSLLRGRNAHVVQESLHQVI